jgi:hypothetical protein
VFATACTFSPRLIFVGKTGAYLSGALYGSPLMIAWKYFTRIKVADGEKYSSLLRYENNYSLKSFIIQAPGIWNHDYKPFLIHIIITHAD